MQIYKQQYLVKEKTARLHFTKMAKLLFFFFFLSLRFWKMSGPHDGEWKRNDVWKRYNVYDVCPPQDVALFTDAVIAKGATIKTKDHFRYKPSTKRKKWQVEVKISQDKLTTANLQDTKMSTGNPVTANILTLCQLFASSIHWKRISLTDLKSTLKLHCLRNSKQFEINLV